MSNHHQVVIIGSGFAGIVAGIRLKQIGFNDFIMLERADQMGGTWQQNHYPGAAVDVVSILYSLSFEQWDWSRSFAKQLEILEYTNHVIDKHGLRERCTCGADVQELRWDEEQKIWHIKTKEKGDYTAQYIINAIGHLSQPMMPDIKGKEDFKGAYFHTARWNHDYDYKGKRVALIGTGASTIQVGPALAPDVKELHVMQRTPSWVMPRHDHEFTPAQRKIRAIPFINRFLRNFTYLKQESRVLAFKYFPAIMKNIIQREALHHIEKSVDSKDLVAKLTPDYTIGCKRILMSNDYYPMFNRDNVVLQDDGIDCINETGIKTKSGKQIDVDLIVYATGFYAFTNEKAVPFEVIGREGKTLKQIWGDTPHAFLGMTIPYLPNLFTMNGPNTGIGHTSAVFMIESQINHIVDAFKKIKANNWQSVEVKETAETDYNQFIQKTTQGSVWNAGGCQSWYLTPEGVNTSIYPTFTIDFHKKTKYFNEQDYLLK